MNLKYFLFFIIILYSSVSKGGDVKTIYRWTGASDSNWNNAANWVDQSGSVHSDPPSNFSWGFGTDYAVVIIESTTTSSPVLSNNVNITSLILKNGSTLEVASGVKINITHEFQYVPESDYPIWDKVENTGAIIIGTTGEMEVQKYFDNSGNITSNGTYTVHNIINNYGSIFIPPTGNVNFYNTLNNDAGAEINIESNINGTGSIITNGSITNTGNMTVERWIDNHDTDVVSGNDNKWHLVSSSVTGAKSGAFLGHFLNYYTSNDVDGKNFHSYKNKGELLEVGQGYIARFDSTKIPNSVGNIIQLVGTFNTGDGLESSNMINGDGNTYFGLPPEFNLVGNPYPSNLDWHQVYADNSGKITDNLYYYVHGIGSSGSNPDGTLVLNGWQVYQTADNNDKRYIGTGQGFGVTLKSGVNNNKLIFNNSQRTHSHSSGSGFNKKNAGNNSFIVLKTVSNNFYDEIKLRFDETSTVNYDENYDAYKFSSFGNAPTPYFISNDGKRLARCVTPNVESIELGFNMSVSGEVTFSISNIQDFTEIILEDKQEETFTELTKDEYTFYYSDNDDETGRFTLHFKKETLSEVEKTVSTKIYSNHNRIFIQTNKPITDATINIYNTSGQLVLSRQYSTLEKEEIDTNLNIGIYIIEITSNEDNIVSKIKLNPL